MWVITGFVGKTSNYTAKKDVWYSQNGTSWFAATQNASFSGRQDPQCVYFNGKMWLMGGRTYDPQIKKNDVWYSGN